jgi:SnoaL-like domain
MKGVTSMSATDIAQIAMQAWESKDANGLASCLSDDFVCRGFLPQPVSKVQYIDFMKAITAAFPDWSFNENFLTEHPFMQRSQRVLFDTQITGTNTGDLILPDLPIIPATGIKIALPNRHFEYVVTDNTVTAITADFSPNGLEEILGQLGMVLP